MPKERVEQLLTELGVKPTFDVSNLQMHIVHLWLDTMSESNGDKSERSLALFRKFNLMWTKYAEFSGSNRDITDCGAVCQSLVLKAPEFLTWACAARTPFKNVNESDPTKGLFAIRYHVENSVKKPDADLVGFVIKEEPSHWVCPLASFVIRDYLEQQQIRSCEFEKAEMMAQSMFDSYRPENQVGEPYFIRIASQPWLNNSVTAVIVLNLIVSVVQLGTVGENGKQVFLGCEIVFTLVFIAEAALKIKAYTFGVYWQSCMNRVVSLLASMPLCKLIDPNSCIHTPGFHC